MYCCILSEPMIVGRIDRQAYEQAEVELRYTALRHHKRGLTKLPMCSTARWLLASYHMDIILRTDCDSKLMLCAQLMT